MRKLIRKYKRYLIKVLLVFALIITLIPLVSIEADSIDLYWFGGSGDWSQTAHWSATSGGPTTHAVPNATNNVHFDVNSFSAASKTVTSPVSQICKDMDWTGATNNPIFSIGTHDLHIYGSLKFLDTAHMSITSPSAIYLLANFSSQILDTQDQSLNADMYIGPNGASTASWTLASNLTLQPVGVLAVYSGTVNTNGKSLIIGALVDYSLSNTRALNITNSTITLKMAGTVGTLWDVGANAGLTLTTTGSTIVIDIVQATSRTFAGENLTYNNITLKGSVTSTVPLIITGSNTFNVFTVDRTVALKSLNITNGSTQTVNQFVCPVSGTRRLTIKNTSSTTAGILTKAGGGTISLDYLLLSYNTGNPANTWYYGTNSTVGSGVTGWNSGDPPTSWTHITSINEILTTKTIYMYEIDINPATTHVTSIGEVPVN